MTKPKSKSEAASIMGSARSKAKTAAAKANGAKGGYWATKKGKAELALSDRVKALKRGDKIDPELMNFIKRNSIPANLEYKD